MKVPLAHTMSESSGANSIEALNDVLYINTCKKMTFAPKSVPTFVYRYNHGMNISYSTEANITQIQASDETKEGLILLYTNTKEVCPYDKKVPLQLQVNLRCGRESKMPKILTENPCKQNLVIYSQKGCMKMTQNKNVGIDDLIDIEPVVFDQPQQPAEEPVDQSVSLSMESGQKFEIDSKPMRAAPKKRCMSEADGTSSPCDGEKTEEDTAEWFAVSMSTEDFVMSVVGIFSVGFLLEVLQ